MRLKIWISWQILFIAFRTVCNEAGMSMGLVTNTKSLMGFVRCKEHLMNKFWSLSIDKW